LLPFYLFTFLPLHAQIGSWRNYLAYHDVQQIQAAGSSQLFVLASNNLYRYNRQDYTIHTYDKTNGMSDVYITQIRWCQEVRRLIAVYGNTNIDLIDTSDNVTNVSDIYSKSITGEKSINNVTINGRYAYLACGFGVVKLDMKQAEISESYMLGFSVKAIAFEGNYIYAQSQTNGVWRALLSDNLIDPGNWTKVSAYPAFTQDNTDYDTYIEEVKTLQPGGPKYNYFGFLRFANGQLYSCNGNSGTTQPGCIQILNNGNWNIYKDDDISSQSGYNYITIYCLDYDPNDISHVFAGAMNGLYEFRNGQFVKLYNSTNSPIEAFNGTSMNHQLVTGVKFDANGTLWLLNSQAPTKAMIKYSNGTFTSVPQPVLMKLDEAPFKNKSNGFMCNMMIDREGYMWFVNDNWALAALYRYNISTNTITAYEKIVNQDGIAIQNLYHVTSVVEDLENNIWIGTDQGPFMLERARIENGESIFTQVKVPRNDGTNYADYLLSGIYIHDIVVDAAGRKWFATDGNGVYLISADNMTQLQHFTVENSNLLSNTVLDIDINNETGEVFFGAANGLCSYMSDATTTYDEMTKDNVWAYPNPVTPDYQGLITVVGLTLNADVKILASNGALVAEGRSSGGTFTWNGCDKNGDPVASGVYMVATAKADGSKGTVCKIAIVR
jgi:hypothetical protein